MNIKISWSDMLAVVKARLTRKKKKKSGSHEHHVIPISMEGEDRDCNTILIKKEQHRELHRQQNIDYNELREARKLSNSFQEKNSFYWSIWLPVWKAFFRTKSDGDLVEHNMQVASLKQTIEFHARRTGSKIQYHGTDIDKLLEEIARLRSKKRK